VELVTHKELQCRLNLSLQEKENFTAEVIHQWYEYWEGEVYVAFSGGVDSTVLLHQVRKLYPDVVAVFNNTGLEYPEIRTFVKEMDNVTILHPKLSFNKVIKKWGYPILSKEISGKIYEIRNTKSEKLLNKRLSGDAKGHGKLSTKWQFLVDAPFKISNRCCSILKKRPAKSYEKKIGKVPMLGTMITDSALRKMAYIQQGCNVFVSYRPASAPLAIWSTKNVWQYIEKYNIPYSPIYDMGYETTGCMFCMFGIHKEEGENRFQKMAITHPKQYKYCIEKLELNAVLDYLHINYTPRNTLFSSTEIRKHCKRG
jgi:3'-phosphoadenosine 5'-phosphosulfate sulfotransferase (PAPS reductase)/FAD synthetase